MDKTPEKQHKNSFDWLKEYQWQKGQSGNPNGRPKTRTLKEFAREYLANMSEEGRIAYFKGLNPEIVWRMAEGNPKDEGEFKHKHTISDVLDNLDHGQETSGQTMEAEPPIQDSEQTGTTDSVQSEQGAEPLPPEQVEPQLNTQE